MADYLTNYTHPGSDEAQFDIGEILTERDARKEVMRDMIVRDLAIE